MRVVNERWNELENELGLGLPLNTLSEVDIANKWRLRALNAEKLLNQPQLTIPKIVIEYYESGDNLYLSWLYANDMLKVNDEQALKKREDEIIIRKAILQAYLAGKALGVELVKVVADE